MLTTKLVLSETYSEPLTVLRVLQGMWYNLYNILMKKLVIIFKQRKMQHREVIVRQ